MSRNSGFQLRSERLVVNENDVERGCLDVLALHKWYVMRQHCGVYRTMDGERVVTLGMKGLPDYLVAKAPAFFLETKSSTGKLSPDQIQRIEELKIGFPAMPTVVVSSVEELAEFLRKHEAGISA